MTLEELEAFIANAVQHNEKVFGVTPKHLIVGPAIAAQVAALQIPSNGYTRLFPKIGREYRVIGKVNGVELLVPKQTDEELLEPNN